MSVMLDIPAGLGKRKPSGALVALLDAAVAGLGRRLNEHAAVLGLQQEVEMDTDGRHHVLKVWAWLDERHVTLALRDQVRDLIRKHGFTCMFIEAVEGVRPKQGSTKKQRRPPCFSFVVRSGPGEKKPHVHYVS